MEDSSVEQQARKWTDKAHKLYDTGRITEDELQEYLTRIAYYRIDPRFPVSI